MVRNGRKSIFASLKYSPIDDSDCYTVAQVDRLISENGLDKKFSKFDVENYRQYLICRMKNRIALATHQPEMLDFRDRDEMCEFFRDVGYGKYLKLRKMCEIDEPIDQLAYLKASETVITYLRRVELPLTNLKFVFSRETVEAKFEYSGNTLVIEQSIENADEGVFVCIIDEEFKVFANEYHDADDVNALLKKI